MAEKAARARPLGAHYASDILRPYHSDDGSVLVKRGSATRGADLVSPEGLAMRLITAANSELLNRPGKGMTMLAGSLFHGLTAAQWALEHPERNGLGQLHIVEQLGEGAKLHQEAQHTVTAAEDVKHSVLTLLQYVAEPGNLDCWRRATMLGAHLYVTGQQVLQVPRPNMCVWSQSRSANRLIHVSGHNCPETKMIEKTQQFGLRLP